MNRKEGEPGGISLCEIKIRREGFRPYTKKIKLFSGGRLIRIVESEPRKQWKRAADLFHIDHTPNDQIGST